MKKSFPKLKFKRLKKLKENKSISLPETESNVKEKLDNLNCD